jgi:hypothetical protein
MNEHQDLRLIPDWPRIRQLVAKDVGKTENEVQAMRDSCDSLDRVLLTMALEEVLHRLHK